MMLLSSIYVHPYKTLNLLCVLNEVLSPTTEMQALRVVSKAKPTIVRRSLSFFSTTSEGRKQRPIFVAVSSNFDVQKKAKDGPGLVVYQMPLFVRTDSTRTHSLTYMFIS